MLQPRIRQRVPAGVVWAADNGCYAQGPSFDADAWVDWLATYPGALRDCLFAVMPDVWGDAAATREQYGYYLPDVRGLGYRVAYVAQAGEQPAAVPWDLLDCLFFGGPDQWRHTERAWALAQEAQARGKWIHVGRVNSARRVRAWAQVGADSVDGTILRYDPHRDVVDWVRAAEAQPPLW